MRCPFCNTDSDKVINSRPTDEGITIRRRRECLNCKKRYTTFEKVDNIPLRVIKKDKSREIFDKDKILKGLLKACEKRPVSTSELENLIYEIEMQVLNSMEREINSQIIGELIMEKLKIMDEVSYVRFASVYRQFKDIQTFMKEIEKLSKEK
ncbi:MAG: transcriptional regulator NrdR [Clostridiales bacterium]